MVSFRAKRFRPEILRSLAAGSVGASYTAIGTKFRHPICVLWLQNLTDATLMFSVGGTLDHFVLPACSFFVLDITANKTLKASSHVAAEETLYVKQLGVPTTGSVYLTVFHNASD